MLGLCSHNAGVIACVIKRDRLRVFLVHDTKSFNLFKERYEDILNDPKGRQPVLLIDGVSVFKLVIDSGVDLSRFVVVLFASYKTITSYEGITPIDVDENGSPLSLGVAEISYRILKGDKGLPPGFVPSSHQRRGEAMAEPGNNIIEETTNKTTSRGGGMEFQETPTIIKHPKLLVSNLRFITMNDIKDIERGYDRVLWEVRQEVEGLNKEPKEEKDALHSLVKSVVNEFGLPIEEEVDVHERVVAFIFSKEPPIKLANRLKDLITPKYAIRIAKETHAKRRKLRRAFFLTKNGTDVKEALARTNVCLGDLFMVYTFVETAFLLPRAKKQKKRKRG